jgi:hypothetical protein
MSMGTARYSTVSVISSEPVSPSLSVTLRTMV